MHLNKLRLFNFKNYEEAHLELRGDIQCFFGRNGSGKTNLLDAVHYLSFTKSAIDPADARNARNGASQFFISGEFEIAGVLHEITCGFQSPRKTMSEDGQVYAKFSKHIGKYPAVLIAPNDIALIWDGSELRRRFFDNLLSQLDVRYLEDLIVYTQVLRQRNGLMKLFAESGQSDPDLLAAYDAKLVPSGQLIFEKRKELMRSFLPLFVRHYNFLAGDGGEKVELIYRSELAEADFGTELQRNLSRDILLQRTGIGIHRDDFLFLLDGGELKRLGSQGQQKSFLIALKLTEFELIARAKGIKPLLLLDDVFDKLDDERIHKLMLLVAGGTFGQLLITDARAGRSREILRETGISATLYEVDNGRVTAVE